jgi:hypothetical protein
MTSDERRKILESFGRSPALLSAALREFPRKMWLYKPSANLWSIHEIILHLADSEASAYILCRHFIAEPGSSPVEFDAGRWADSLGYFHQSTREALEIIRRLRKMTYQLLASLPDPIWSNAVEQPDDGLLRLEDWVEIQERHIPHHIEQMKQNYELWLKANPPRKPASPSGRMSAGAPARMITLSAGL